MDMFPFFNSLRIALISSVLIFFLGIYLARLTIKAPRLLRGVLDAIITLPLVLPPTVVGFFLLKLIGTNSPLGSVLIDWFDLRLTMQWYSGVIAATVVALPLMYRTARGAFLALDSDMLNAARLMGHGEGYIFWRLMLPNSKQGLLAGIVLSFARALGEYGATSMVAGYIPNRTATVSTAVYQLWREGNDALAFKYVLINLAVALVVLMALAMFERGFKDVTRKGGVR